MKSTFLEKSTYYKVKGARPIIGHTPFVCFSVNHRLLIEGNYPLKQ